MQNKWQWYIKVIIALCLAVFAGLFIYNSFTDLSINYQQSLYGWENNYGFYEQEAVGDTSFRWTKEQASEVLAKESNYITVPIKAGNPDIEENPIKVKMYIDNRPKRIIELNNDQWVHVDIDVSHVDRDRFTFTIDTSRTWIPSKWGVSNDSRKLGIAVGEIKYN